MLGAYEITAASTTVTGECLLSEIAACISLLLTTT